MLIHKQTLYEYGFEEDHVVIAQTAILLSFYNSNSNAMINSTWLSVAIEHAQTVNFHEYDYIQPSGNHNQSELKRLWHCCILRDRVISLGMRRPIQIVPEKYPVKGSLLSLDDLQDELRGSEVYSSEVKTILSCVVIGLCEFATAVTDLLLILYPPHRQSIWVTPYTSGTTWEHIERVRSRLSVWERNFMSTIRHEDYDIHPSITLFISLTHMYYQYVLFLTVDVWH
jgi:hypothetical protein